MINGKDMKGSGGDVRYILHKELRKVTKEASVMIIGLQAEIRAQDLQNTKN
jgi:hypothetical protein